MQLSPIEFDPAIPRTKASTTEGIGQRRRTRLLAVDLFDSKSFETHSPHGFDNAAQRAVEL